MCEASKNLLEAELAIFFQLSSSFKDFLKIAPDIIFWPSEPSPANFSVLLHVVPVQRV